MRGIQLSMTMIVFCAFLLSSCTYHSASTSTRYDQLASKSKPEPKMPANYASRLPQNITTREKVIVIDPRVHAWGAYDSGGNLLRAGLATAGSSWCPDIKRACRTRAGSFRIKSLGSAGCKSTIYPLPRGGAPMPYCMFFNGHQGLHGSPYTVEGNVSHGCVRVRVDDAEWIRFDFARIGTKIIVRSY